MDLEDKLKLIADQLQHWLDFQAEQRAREDLPCADDTHIITPPTWPTRAQLQAWIEVLRASSERIEKAEDDENEMFHASLERRFA
jgi:hypothetical protein